MQIVTREQVKEMMDQPDVIVVEVLPAESFHEFHIPGAINIPYTESFKEQVQQIIPDKQQKVVVYCANAQCQASPKAAQAMEELGYRNVFDYEMGKADWKEAHMPIET